MQYLVRTWNIQNGKDQKSNGELILQPHPELPLKQGEPGLEMFRVKDVRSHEIQEYQNWSDTVAEAVFVMDKISITPDSERIIQSIKTRHQKELYQIWKDYSDERIRASRKRFQQWGITRRMIALTKTLLRQEQENWIRSTMYGLEWKIGIMDQADMPDKQL